MEYRIQECSETSVMNRRHFLRRLGAASATCAVVPGLVACTMVAARDDNRFTVEMTENRRFEPASLTIPVGSIVVWDNTSQRRHAVTTDASDLGGAEAIALSPGVEPWGSGDMYVGDTWALTFTVPGDYVYVCPYHHESGMIGTIVVEE